MKLKPLNKKIIVKKVKEAEESRGGIIIPVMKAKTVSSEILAISDQSELKDSIKAGDNAVFHKGSMLDIKVGKYEMALLDEDSILGLKNT